MAVDYSLGFRSLSEEVSGRRLDVEGELPDWLDGTLLRNGPGKFEAGGERVDHWFDGLAMLTKFDFDGDGVAYSNHFLRSDTFERARGGTLDSGQFATSSSGNVLSRLKGLVIPEPTDNANVNVLRLGDRFVAITETPVGVEFDPETLETRGRFTFEDDLRAQMTTAHPHYDRDGAVVNVATAFGRRHYYKLYRVPAGTTRREEVARFRIDRPSYVHSFALTPNYAVIAEVPFDVKPSRFLRPWGGESFIEHYEWRPERGTRFLVFDRERGAAVAERGTEAFFCFHHVNAFEADGELVIDLVAFPGPEAIRNRYLDQLEGGVPALDGQLRRYRLPVDGRGGGQRRMVYDRGMTLPRIHPDRDGRRYRYAYGRGTPDPDADRPPRLVKVDVESGTAVEHDEPGAFCGEPVFVPRHGGEGGSAGGGHRDETGSGEAGGGDVTRGEDDGVVLSVALDVEAERSTLLVLDGESFEVRARAPLPHAVPFDFHGQYFGDL